MADWNSSQYLKFKNERTQPSIDLINRIVISDPADIIDIGCGPGNSTEQLKVRFPDANVTGADNSADMLDTARRTYSNIDFILCDASKDLGNIGKNLILFFLTHVFSGCPTIKSSFPK